jgi:hypothetical protein
MEQAKTDYAEGFTRYDDKLVLSKNLSFVDKGFVSPGSVTRKFQVVSRYDQSLLGYVRWFPHWRQYVFYPLNCILNKDCLREAASYCEEVTASHKAKRQAFPAIV